MEEMAQAHGIALQALEKIEKEKPGEFVVKDYKIAPVPRERINSSIEELIHHFMYWTDGIHVPEGEAYGFIEGSKGEIGFFVSSNGTALPQRVKVRGTSFANLSALPAMVKVRLIADFVAAVGSIDVILGEVDR